MPKMKTNRSAAKRFKFTGSGKIKRRRKNMRHIMTKMSRKRQRRLHGWEIVDSANEKAIRRMLPYGSD
jgi:large subunit ribosomal protein L35